MKKIISLLLCTALLFTAFAQFVIADTESKQIVFFEEDFDAKSKNVRISADSFSYVARPENNASVNTQEAYGALMSDADAVAKVTVNFDKLYTSNIIYEADFRLEGASTEDAYKFKPAHFYRGTTDVTMITLIDAQDNGYRLRVCSRDDVGDAKFIMSEFRLPYKTWHKLRVLFDFNNNCYSVYVNGEEVAVDVAPYKNSISAGIDNVTVHTDAAMGAAFLVDNVTIKSNFEITSSVYTIENGSIYGDFEAVTAEDFLDALTIPDYASYTLYSDYASKTVNSGLVAHGDVLEVKAKDAAEYTYLYTINAHTYATQYYIAPDGNDLNDGTTPKTAFASLNHAKTAVRYAKQMQPNAAYCVNFLAGDYSIEDTMEFTNADSGSAQYPITYKAYGDGPVRFKGSVTLDVNTDVKKVTDTEILNSIISTTARENLYQIDLKAKGINIPTMPNNYGFSKSGYTPLRVYINGQALTEARFPNDLHIPIKSMNNGDTCTKDGYYDFYYYDADAPISRTRLWDTENRNIYIAGTIGTQYSYNHILVDSFDPQNTRIKTDGTISFTPAIGRAYFYFTNIMEEIDVPGESYLDEKNEILYFLPHEDLENATIEIGVFDENMLYLDNADYLTFENLEFVYAQETMIEAVNTDYFTLRGCTLAHTGATAITLNGHHTLIENNHIYDLAGKSGIGGVHLTGSGDRESLTSGGSIIRNNTIHDTDVIYKVSQSPAIYILDSVGTEISNNEIYNGTAYMVRITDCNDIVIKRNIIHDAVTMSSDAGAVTWGRDVTLLGFQVIENYFYNIGNDIGMREQESTGQVCKRIGQQALFHDDGSSGPYAYGNIFYNATPRTERNEFFSVKANGGQYGIWENNIFIGGDSAVRFGSWRIDTDAQDRWWLTNYNVYEAQRDEDGKKSSTSIYWDRINNSSIHFMSNEVWKAKYSEQFGAYWTLFTAEQKEALEAAYVAGTEAKNNAALLKLADRHAALLTNTNCMKNNVLIDTITPREYEQVANYHEKTGSVTAKFDSATAAAYFADYGTDFTLTPEGLAKIQEKIPAFQAIDFSKIGPQADGGKAAAGLVLEKDGDMLRIINKGEGPKSGVLAVVASDGKYEKTVLLEAITVSGKGELKRQLTLPAGYESCKAFVLKNVFSMQIFSNIIE